MSMSAQSPVNQDYGGGVLSRLWIYQAQRFPVLKTSVLLLVFASASLSVSAHLGGRALPGLWTFAAIWLSVIIIFFQMRACDEYKDLEDDRIYRPERPIPSGVIALQLILGLAATGVIVAAALTVSVHERLFLPLLGVWFWLGLMTVEFFAPGWLKSRAAIYLFAHMAIMPLIDLYITAAEWLPHGWYPPQGLWLFLCLSFVNGCVIELGRKIWAPENERRGVESYSSLIGPGRAAYLWAGTCVLAWCLLVGVGVLVGRPVLVALPGLLVLAAAVGAALAFARHPTPARQKLIDNMAGLWVFACYALAGFAPLMAWGPA